MSSYTTMFTVDRTPEEAYDAILDVRGWWSAVEGVTDQVGGEFLHRYQDFHRTRLRVIELDPGRKVIWHVLDNYFSFISDQREWKDTFIVFDIASRPGGTEVTFTHVGLVQDDECYDVCADAWSGYLHGSLPSLINTGVGEPNPPEDGEAPAHQDDARRRRLTHTG